METIFQAMYADLKSELHAIQRQENNTVFLAKKSTQAATEALQKLKKYLTETPLKCESEEIDFFKKVKPNFHCELVYWATILGIELRRPIADNQVIINYLSKQFLKIQLNFQENADFYSYYRSGDTEEDQKYFLPKYNTGNINDPHLADCDPGFSSSHDYMVTRLLADQKLLEYLHNEMGLLKNPIPNKESDQKDKLPLTWTASKAGLVELIYALQSGAVYNNGNAGIREIAEHFEKLFKVDLGNYYHIFNEIRLRKKSRAQLLDHLKARLLVKMDELDEK
jgi:hypothetical protein